MILLTKDGLRTLNALKPTKTISMYLITTCCKGLTPPVILNLFKINRTQESSLFKILAPSN